MNIYGFLTALVVCAALVVIVWLATHKAINIRIIRATETPRFVPIEAPKVTAEEIQKTPVTVGQELKEKVDTDPFKQMDAVIKSVNEMMGISIDNGDKDE